ncbi:MAG: bifunctional riboflavin kinase/FAD synthetase [Flavobacteriales bacterium]|nr:bifunctional riboflavin kinase/FAD synthetase [Flavobacteriales bacterium]
MSYNSLEDFKPDFKTIVTIGTFDGVHFGHKYIIEHLNRIAKREGGQSVLLTFSPHPRHVLYEDHHDLKLLNTLEEKKEVLKEIELQNFVVQNFTKEFSRMKYVNFVRDILVKRLNVDHLVIGYDHHFGRNREGSIKELQELSALYNFTLEQIPPQKKNDVPVSSTKIRKLLQEGNIENANKYLGYEYMLTGNVVHGDKMGRTINYPTANIEVQDFKLIPKAGVYLVKLDFMTINYFGMLNIGIKTNKIEVHIFNFSNEIYNERIKIKLLSRLRDGLDFNNSMDLKKQLQQDEKKCKSILGIS